MRRQPKIFISYRADDDGLSAHLLYADLKARIGQQHLFMDLDALQSGDVGRFPALAAMRDCDAVLLLIGPRWMEPEKPGGSVLDPDDFVAGEIEEAQRLGKPILPVLLDHAKPPRPKQLPEKLWFLFKDRPLQFREESHRIDARLIEERVRPLVKGLKKSRRGGAGSPSWRRPMAEAPTT